jgi:hypothetical protein
VPAFAYCSITVPTAWHGNALILGGTLVPISGLGRMLLDN